MMTVNRGDAYAFMSSINVVFDELRKAEKTQGIAIPVCVYNELSAMKTVLSREYLSKERYCKST